MSTAREQAQAFPVGTQVRRASTDEYLGWVTPIRRTDGRVVVRNYWTNRTAAYWPSQLKRIEPQAHTTRGYAPPWTPIPEAGDQ